MKDKADQLADFYEEELARFEEQKILITVLKAQVCRLLGLPPAANRKDIFNFLPNTPWGLSADLKSTRVYYQDNIPIYLAPKDIRLFRNEEYGLVGWGVMGTYFYIFRQSNQILDSDIAKILGAG